jgi:hypothetical protein
VRVAQLVAIADRHDSLRYVSAVKTDSLVLQGASAKKRKLLQDEVESTTFAELPELRRKHRGLEPGQQMLGVQCEMAGVPSQDQPFRYIANGKVLRQGVF